MKSKALDDSIKYVDKEIDKSSKSALLSASFFMIIDELATSESEVIERLSTTSHDHSDKKEVEIHGSPEKLQIFEKNIHKVYSGVIVEYFEMV